MRYLTNTIKAIINLGIDLVFFYASMYLWFTKFADHSKGDMVLFIISTILLTIVLDVLCNGVLSRKYDEEVTSELLAATLNKMHINTENSDEDE